MPTSASRAAIVIGGGPTGLMAAETLTKQGIKVELYEAMPSVGRKFLLAGKGGLNLSHSEPLPQFLARYAERRSWLEPILEAFGPAEIRAWAEGLGVATFIGSSGRIFPCDFNAAPLLRAWLKRLRQTGVIFHVRHRWQGWNDREELGFATPDGLVSVPHNGATILALGGGSWPQLGSDGNWLPVLARQGIETVPLEPANCGFNYHWTAYFRDKYAGHPLKPVAATLLAAGQEHFQTGEFIITADGVEGSLIYALSAKLRGLIKAQGHALLYLDLAPGHSHAVLRKKLTEPRGTCSLANHLRRKASIAGVKMGLLRELLPTETFSDMAALAMAIKHLPLQLLAPRPLAEAISSAGGVALAALDEQLMLRARPGVFCAGEMIDWEAPTGGYLLTACLAQGRAAGDYAAAWMLKNRQTGFQWNTLPAPGSGADALAPPPGSAVPAPE